MCIGYHSIVDIISYVCHQGNSYQLKFSRMKDSRSLYERREGGLCAPEGS